MSEDGEEAKEWFQDRGLEKQRDIIKAWEEQDTEELERQTGERFEGFQLMMEEIIELQSQMESRRGLIKQLEDEGFDLIIARSIAVSVEETEGDIVIDLRYLRRNTTVEEMKELARGAVDMFLGEITTEQYEDLHENPDVLQATQAQLWTYIRSANRYRRRDLLNYRDVMKSQANFSDERVDAFLQPVEKNYDELRERAAYKIIEEIEQRSKNIEGKLEKLVALIESNLDALEGERLD